MILWKSTAASQKMNRKRIAIPIREIIIPRRTAENSLIRAIMSFNAFINRIPIIRTREWHCWTTITRTPEKYKSKEQ